MAKWLKNLKLSIDGRARTFAIIIVAIVVLVALFFAFKYFNKSSGAQGHASLSAVPDIQSTPITGGQQNQEYLSTLLASNQSAAQKALRSGKSEVPSIIASNYQPQGTNLTATPDAQKGACPTCCCRVCQSKQTSNDAGGEIAKLESEGKLSPLVAGQLKQLQADGLTPSEYAAQLQQLVKEGKLTPAEAEALESAYNKAHGVTGAGSSISASPNSVVDGLLSSGSITPATAAALKKLNGENLSPSDYAQRLAELVKEGKLTPAEAKKLMASYDKEHGVTPSQATLDGLVAGGSISPTTAAALKKLNAENLSPSDYAKRLAELVKEGKLTPAEAKKLMDAYSKEHKTSPSDAAIDGLLASGAITPATAAELKKLDGENLSPSDYAAKLRELVREGKLSPSAAKALMSAYDKTHGISGSTDTVNGLLASGAITKSTAAALKKLNGENLSPADYAKQLQKLVSEGKLSPSAAKALMAAYDKDHGSSSANDAVNKLLASGDITPGTASELHKLNAEGLTPQQYAAKLAQMVKDGKLTAAQASALEAAYSKDHGVSSAASPDSLVSELEKSGQITPAAAAELKQLNGEGLTPAQYKAKLAQLVKEGKLSPAAASRLLAAYTAQHKQSGATPDSLVAQLAKDGSISPSTAAALQALNGQNLSPSQYADKLDQLVKEGKLTAAQAKALEDAYNQQHQAKSSGALSKMLANEEAAEAANEAANQTADNDALNQQATQLAQQQAQAKQQAMQASISAISAQAKQVLSAWTPGKQQVSGSFGMLKQSSGDQELGIPGSTSASSKAGKSSAATTGKYIARAGDIMFAVLDTAVDSDDPGPVMATIVTGPYKGAKLLGVLQKTTNSEAVVLRFVTMSYGKWPKSVTISAVAINPNTARTALASSVNHHYLERFGAVFAASFMQGLGKAIENSGSTATNNSGTSTQTFANLNTTEKALVGLGQVGETFGKEFNKYMNIPVTVKVNSGVGMGILFTKDAALPDFAAGGTSSSPSPTATSSSSTASSTTSSETQ